MGKAVGHATIMLPAPDSVAMPPAPTSEGLCACSGGRQARQQTPLAHQIGTQAQSDWKKSGPDLITNYRKLVSKWRVRACTGVPTPLTPRRCHSETRACEGESNGGGLDPQTFRRASKTGA